MPVEIPVSTRLDVRSAEAAANAVKALFSRTGREISSEYDKLGSSLLNSFNGSRFAEQQEAMRAEMAKTVRAEQEAARLAIRADNEVIASKRRLAEQTAKYGDESSQAAKAAGAYADKQALAAQAHRESADAILAADAATTKFAGSHDKAAASASNAARIFNAAGVTSIAALGIAFAETGKLAGDFQQGMTKLSASADLPIDQIKAVQDGILKMTGTVGYSAGELTNAFYTIQKAQLQGANGAATAAEKLDVLKASAQGATVEQAPLPEVINAVTTSLTDFNLPADQAANVMSKLVTAVGESKTNLNDFAGSLHNVEPVARLAGVSIDQVYGSIARLTQSGTSPDQATQNLAQTMRNFMNPSQQMRDSLGKLHLSAEQLQKDMADPQVGIVGVLKEVSEAIRGQVGPSGQVAIDTFYKNADASQALKTAYEGLTPASKAFADELNSGVAPNMRKLHEQALADPKLAQWVTLRNHVDGLSQNLRRLQPELETVQQAWKEATGGAETLNVASQLVGSPEDIQKTLDAIKKVSQSTTDAGNNVKGFNETQDTLNQKMRDARAAFGAAAIELGTSFIPVMTDVANVAKTVGDLLAQNPGLARDAVDAMEGLAGIWLAYKAVTSQTAQDAVKALKWIGTQTGLLKDQTIADSAAASEKQIADQGRVSGAAEKTNAALGPQRATAAAEGERGVAAAATAEVGEENAVAEAAGRADGAIAGGAAGAGGGMAGLLGPAAAVAGVDMAAHQTPAGSPLRSIVSSALPFDPTLKPDAGPDAPWYKRDAMRDLWNWATKPEGHVAGGPVDGPGPKGKDSVASWLAPGEHVLTASDVDAAGGHSGVYAWRNALHRELGGPSDADLPDGPGDYVVSPDGLTTAMQYAAKNSGRQYQYGTLWDCSGFMSQLYGIVTGKPAPTGQRFFSTESDFTKLGFLPGYDPNSPFNIGVHNGGGGMNSHMAGTIGGHNVESGGHGVQFGGQVGALDPQFEHHYHLPGSMGTGGADGYYSPDPDKVAKVENEIKRKNDNIHDLEEKLAELKSNAKQSERDRIQHEIDHAKDDLKLLDRKLAEAQQGTFHRGRSGGRGRSGSGGSWQPQFGAPLPANFGLDKGLSGLVEWAITAAADAAIGPVEGAAYGDALRSGAFGDIGGGSGSFGDVADAMGVPTSSLAGDYSAGAGGSGSYGGGSGGGVGSGGGGSAGSQWWAPGSGKAATGGAGGSWWSPGFTTDANKYANEPSVLPPAPGAPSTPSAAQMGPNRIFAGFPGELPLNSLSGAGGTGALPGIGPAGGSAYASKTAFQGYMDALGGQSNAAQQDRDSARAAREKAASDAVSAATTPGQRAGDNAFLDQLYPSAIHRANGGPSGTDTIPAWLSPGEYVLNSSQVDKLGGPDAVQKFMKAHRYATGGEVDDAENGSRQPSTAQNASGGLDVGGGSLGMAEAAGAMAVNGLAPGAGQAVQVGTQEANRAVKYGAQLGGIAVQGLFETLALNDSVLSDPSKSWIGRFGAGLAGAHPSSPNSAGKAAPPLKKESNHEDGGRSEHLGTGQPPGPSGNAPLIGNINMGNNGDPHAAAREINRQVGAYPGMGGR
jgi:TP901 family phage tail tape measure protein